MTWISAEQSLPEEAEGIMSREVVVKANHIWTCGTNTYKARLQYFCGKPYVWRVSSLFDSRLAPPRELSTKSVTLWKEIEDA